MSVSVRASPGCVDPSRARSRRSRKGPAGIVLRRLAVEVSRRAMGSALRAGRVPPGAGSAPAWRGVGLTGHMTGQINDHGLAAPPRRKGLPCPSRAGSLASALSEPAWNPIMGRMGLVFAAQRARGPGARGLVALRFAGLSRLASAQARDLPRGRPPRQGERQGCRYQTIGIPLGWLRREAGASCHRALLSSCLKRNGLSLIPLAATVRASFACPAHGIGQWPELERSRWT
jgi:hypothetical protein